MYHCVRCGHDWNTRITGRPCNCPQCKSPLWDRPRTSVQKVRLAHSLVHRAIKTGKLIPQPCKVCGTDKRVVAHHEDYDRPLEVDWYCNRHHQLRHVEIGDALAEVVDHNGKTGCTLHIDDEILDHAATLAKEQNRTPSYFLRMWLVAGMAKELGLDPSIVEQANVDFRNCSGRKKLAEQKKSEIVPPAPGADFPQGTSALNKLKTTSLETSDAIYVEHEPMQPLSQRTLPTKPENLPRMPQLIHERISGETDDDARAKNEGCVSELRSRISETRSSQETAMPSLRVTGVTNAPPGLHETADSGMDVPTMPPSTSQRGEEVRSGNVSQAEYDGMMEQVVLTIDKELRMDAGLPPFTPEEIAVGKALDALLPPFGEHLVEDVYEPEWYNSDRILQLDPDQAIEFTGPKETLDAIAAGKHKAHHGRKPKVKALAEKIPGVGSAADLPKPKAPLCKKEGHGGFWRSDGYWCAKCGKLYREG